MGRKKGSSTSPNNQFEGFAFEDEGDDELDAAMAEQGFIPRGSGSFARSAPLLSDEAPEYL